MSDPTGRLPAEQQDIRARCVHSTGAFVEFMKEETEQSIPERFEQMVGRYPDRVAVKTRSRRLTYGALNTFANRIARAIVRQRGEGQEPVALLFEDAAAMLAAILGALKAGKIFVVLAPSFPRARMAHILEDSQAGLLLTDGASLSPASGLASDECRLMNVDELDAGLAGANLRLSIAPDRFAYIVYTSGSTGQPKGVLQNHRNVLHEGMLYANALHVTPEDRLALLFSCSASQGLKITFAALLSGAALCPFDLQREGVGPLTPWLIQEDITLYFSIPAVFRQWVDTLTGQEALPRLRVIHLGSDSVTRKEVEAYRTHRFENTTLVVRLGSTEAGTLRTCFFDRERPVVEDLVPVGYAVEDMDVSLLDEDGQPVEAHRAGEIAVRSRYLSPGYWRSAELTRETFLPDPNGGDVVTYHTGDLGRMGPDGCLYHLGRKDFQVKVRGHRIEVAEIESALLELSSIKEAVVTAREDQPGDPRLVAYVVAKDHPAPSVSELHRFLKDRLPGYMAPSAFVFLDGLPLTPSGKVQRRDLPDPQGARPELDVAFMAPRTPLEGALASIWAEVLGLDRVGIHDPFLELGGHSLAATQVMARLVERLGVDLPMPALFEAPTVADLAEVVARYQKPAH